jgi:hypothetical protein
MTPDDQSQLSIDKLEEFARNVLRMHRSGPWPLEDVEHLVVVLAEMVIALANFSKAQRDLCEAGRQSGDALACLLDHLGHKTLPLA